MFIVRFTSVILLYHVGQDPVPMALVFRMTLELVGTLITNVLVSSNPSTVHSIPHKSILNHNTTKL